MNTGHDDSPNDDSTSSPRAWLPWAMAALAVAGVLVLLVVARPRSTSNAGSGHWGESVWLTASARPTSAIHVDGKKYVDRGEVRDLELDPGAHEIRLVPADGITPEGQFSLELDEEGDRQSWCFEYRGGAWQAERCGP
jgi:hypothetical protein